MTANDLSDQTTMKGKLSESTCVVIIAYLKMVMSSTWVVFATQQ